MSFSPPPTLVTDRLVLRPPVVDDLEGSVAMWSDTDVVRHVGGGVRSARDCWLNLCRNRGMWDLLGYGYFTARDRRSGEFVGQVGAGDFRRGLTPDLSPYPETGWAFAKKWWGKGLATEAANALHSWLAAAHPEKDCVCIIDEENAASLRIAGRLGYQEWARTLYAGAPIIIFRKPASG